MSLAHEAWQCTLAHLYVIHHLYVRDCWRLPHCTLAHRPGVVLYSSVVCFRLLGLGWPGRAGRCGAGAFPNFFFLATTPPIHRSHCWCGEDRRVAKTFHQHSTNPATARALFSVGATFAAVDQAFTRTALMRYAFLVHDAHDGPIRLRQAADGERCG